MNPKNLFAIEYKEPNKYSWVTLIAAMEQEGIFSNGKWEFSDKINLSQLEKYDKVVLGFSLMTIQMNEFAEFMNAKLLNFKNKKKNIFIIAGGPHVSARPEELIELGVDFAVVGEGEFALKQILHFLTEKKNPEPNEFEYPGVYVKGKTLSKNYKEIVDLNTYPPYSEMFRLFGPIEITRGCPYACKYCQTGSMYDKVRHAEIESIYRWLKRLSEIKFDKCWFLSPNALSYGSHNNKPQPEILESLLSKLHEIKAIKQIYFGTFPSEVRPEFVREDVLQAIKPYIANDYFVVGAQAVTNSLLKKIGRTHSVEDIYACIQTLEKFKFTAEIDLIFGLPGETEEDIIGTVDFLGDVESKFSNVRVRGHTFMPLPGTVFELESTGSIDSRILKMMGRLTKIKKARGEYFEQAKFNH